MKKKLVGALVLAVVLFFGQIGTSRAGDIKYDTFCDGMHFTLDVTTGLVTANQTGASCPTPITGNMLGTLDFIVGQGWGFTMAYDSAARYAGFMTVIRFDKTWTHYQNTGGVVTVLNSGTWSPGVAAPARAGLTASGAK